MRLSGAKRKAQSMSNWTPAPWTAEPYSGSAADGFDIVSVKYAANGRALYGSVGVTHSKRADAELIALAPEMAEALSLLNDCNYDHDCDGEGDHPRCKECEAVGALHTVMAKLRAIGGDNE